MKRSARVLGEPSAHFRHILLDPQRILFIGMRSRATLVRTSKFFDIFDVHEYQLVAWNAETLVAETQAKTGQSLQSYHHPFVYRRFKELYDEKIIQILNWVKLGHVLVVFPYLFDDGMTTDGRSGVTDVSINQFPPFNLVSVTRVRNELLHAVDEFRQQFDEFINILKCELVLSGIDMVPLFRIVENDHDNPAIAGAAFRVGKGVIVFSPTPKAWDNPKLLEYLDALARLPEMLSRPVDPLPERTSALQRPALWLTALPTFIITAIALSPFWAPQVERLLPWGGLPPAVGQDYEALAARLKEIEKRPALWSLDVDAIKSAESSLSRRIDQLEAVVSRVQELPVVPRSNAPGTPAAPAPGPPHLSTEEIAELLAHGDTLLSRGDVTSARLFYERAANTGDGRAALRLGATFDPAFLGRDVLHRALGDPKAARLWYQRARDFGELEAEQLLKALR